MILCSRSPSLASGCAPYRRSGFILLERSIISTSNLSSRFMTRARIRIEGQLYETGQKLHVTGFEELRDYIRQEFNRRGKEEP